MSFLVLRDSARAVSKARSDLSFRYAMNPVHVLLDEGHVGIDKIKFKKEKGLLEPQANPAASYLSHGYAIGQRLQQISKEFFYVHPGSLYPGLHRLEDKGWLQAERKESETGRQAKFYSPTTFAWRFFQTVQTNVLYPPSWNGTPRWRSNRA
jgi:Transcriptional regulator PadR-like family